LCYFAELNWIVQTNRGQRFGDLVDAADVSIPTSRTMYVIAAEIRSQRRNLFALLNRHRSCFHGHKYFHLQNIFCYGVFL
jgi:hypothetical protein